MTHDIHEQFIGKKFSRFDIDLSIAEELAKSGSFILPVASFLGEKGYVSFIYPNYVILPIEYFDSAETIRNYETGEYVKNVGKKIDHGKFQCSVEGYMKSETVKHQVDSFDSVAFREYDGKPFTRLTFSSFVFDTLDLNEIDNIDSVYRIPDNRGVVVIKRKEYKSGVELYMRYDLVQKADVIYDYETRTIFKNRYKGTAL